MKRFLPGKGTEKIPQRCDEGVLVADQVSWFPEVGGIRMVRAGHQHAFCGLQGGWLGCIEELQPIHVFQVESQTALRSIDLETISIAPANPKAARFKTAQATVREAGNC